MTRLMSWGRISADEHNIIDLVDKTNLELRNSVPGIAHGMGRSYGDVCLNPNGFVWRTTGLDHFISFDCEKGILTCEAGVLLSSIQELVTAKGWMLPVSPGTQLVTLGGAIANDIHGKNHHQLGSFGHHICSIKLLRTSGETITCGPNLLPDWFSATVGGLGLTGVILEASIQLRPIDGPWLETETIPFKNIQEFFKLSEASEKNWEYTVAWIDCLSSEGRGIFMQANHSSEKKQSIQKKRHRRVPFTPPVSFINKLSLNLFNTIYFHTKKWNSGKQLMHYESFFYPLDNLLEWNKLYGVKGFYQYQCVVPLLNGQEAIQKILELISVSGMGSFLAVLKIFGDKPSVGMLSFPIRGITLALDFPNQGERTKMLFEEMDAVVSKANGRIYCAKDASMSREIFEQGYSGLAKFIQYRDPGISSSLSRRLLGL